MDFWWFIVGVVIGLVSMACRAGSSDADDWKPRPRPGPDLFTLVAGIALGAALFGDDDE